MLDCPTCASGNIEHKATHPLTMTSDEAQDWLLAQHNAAPGPPDPARFGAAIRAIRARAIADAKEFGADTGELARLREDSDGLTKVLDFLAIPDPDRALILRAARADTGELARPEQPPTRKDLAETLCFLDHQHWHVDEPSCPKGRHQADRIVRALSARYSSRAALTAIQHTEEEE